MRFLSLIFCIGLIFNGPAMAATSTIQSLGGGGESAYKITVASEGANCTASPCTITRQAVGNAATTWVSSVTRSSTGVYVVNFSSAFSSAPFCTVTSIRATRQMTISSLGTSSLQVNSLNELGGIGDGAFTLICFI